VRQFDMKPYLDTGVFQALRDPAMFNSVRLFLDSIQWQNEADLCPDTLYEQSVPLRSARTAQTASVSSKAKPWLSATCETEPAKVAEAPVKYTTRRRK
jgi:hypothetical protein